MLRKAHSAPLYVFACIRFVICVYLLLKYYVHAPRWQNLTVMCRSSTHLLERNTMGEIQNLVLLDLCWACTLSSSTLLTSIGPLTAEQVGAPESLAPLAVACFLFGAAITYAQHESSNPGPKSLPH